MNGVLAELPAVIKKMIDSQQYENEETCSYGETCD